MTAPDRRTVVDYLAALDERELDSLLSDARMHSYTDLAEQLFGQPEPSTLIDRITEG